MKAMWSFIISFVIAFVIAIALVIALALVPGRAKADTQITLVSPQWVAAHCNDPNIRILDVRQDPHDYFAGHVPNAVHMPDNSLRGPAFGLPNQYLGLRALAATLARAGVRANQKVVVYSEGADVLGATMVAYILERIGHPQVMVMDGGWKAFDATEVGTQAFTLYVPSLLVPIDNSSCRITLSQVKRLVGKTGVTIIDARPPRAYWGQTTTWMRNGHIPGAITVDWHLLTDPQNPHKFRTLAQLQRLYDNRGVRKTDQIVLYCGTSREASMEYVVLKHLLGYPKVRLYEGSWTEYSAHPELKIECGSSNLTASR